MANGLFMLRAARMFSLGDLYWKAADGTGEAEKLASSPDRGLCPWSWSKDGKTLVLGEISTPLCNVTLECSRWKATTQVKPLLQEKYVENQPKISPDGQMDGVCVQ